MLQPNPSSAPGHDAWEFPGNARFEVRRRLGAGSFGVVFEVFDSARDAKVALKLLRSIEPEDLYRFKQEFRALADLTHPNLVELYELSGEGYRWFFTMELVEGRSLLAHVRPLSDPTEAPTLDAAAQPSAVRGIGQARLVAAPPDPAALPPARDRAGFDERRVRSTLVQIVEGLSALHEADKVHRDVKPSNVLVTPEGRVVIVDFGLVARLSATAAVSRVSVVGTPEYLAPEIVQGEPATAASDWYSVGVLLYEALTGRCPFTGTLREILAQKLALDPPRPSALVEGVPPDLDDLCLELLALDPAARPASAALLERLGGAAAPRSGPREVPFVGRRAERARLADLLGEVEARPAASVALVHGPSGIGKSALVDQACADLRRRAPRALLLAARCYEQESVPYKAIDGLIDPLSRYLQQLPPRVLDGLLPADLRALAWLFPVLLQVEAIADSPAPAMAHDPHARRQRAFRALRDLLDRLAARRPLVVVIDDVHWGDQDSALLLLDLLTPPRPPPFFLVVAYRSEEAGTSACLRTLLPGLEALRGPTLPVASIALGALGEPETLALARALLPEARAADADLCAAISREARGRPFLVRELCDRSRERADRADPAGEVSVDALVRARVAALPEGPRRLLELLAVAGRPVDRLAVKRAAELGDEGPSAYLLLRNARLVRSRDAGGQDELEPYHDRIREAVTAGLSAERRAECSRRLAAALAGTGRTDPEALAVYYLDGGDRVRAAEQMSVAAGAAASALAFEGAARLYRRVIELLPPGDPTMAAVHEALGDALANAGRGAEAARALLTAARWAPEDRVFELQRRAAELLLAAGEVDEGLARLRDCLTQTGLRTPSGVWGVALGTVLLFVALSIRGLGFRARQASEVPATTLRRIDAAESASRVLNGVATPLGAYFAVRSLLLALAAGEPRRIFEALILFSVYGAALQGRPAALVDRALALTDQVSAGLDLPEAPAMAQLARGVGGLMKGNLRSMRAELAPIAPALRGFSAGRVWAMNLAQEFWFSCLNWTGAWGDLSDQVPREIAAARARGNGWLERSLLLRYAHLPRLLADDPEGAVRLLTSAREGWWPPRFGLWDSFFACARAEIDLYAERGRGPAAHLVMAAAWPSIARSGLLRIRAHAMHVHLDRARAALAFAAGEEADAGARAAALADAEDAARRLTAIGNPMCRGFARLAEAGLASARGEARAAAAWARAEEALSAAACANFAAAAKRRRGELTGGDEGAALVAEADAWLAAQGALQPARLAVMLAPG